jgi:hypothetical protein
MSTAAILASMSISWTLQAMLGQSLTEQRPPHQVALVLSSFQHMALLMLWLFHHVHVVLAGEAV